MLRNVVPNSFVTPEGRMSRLGGWPNKIIRYVIHFFKLFRQKFDNRRADQNLSAAAACRIYWRRRRTGGGAHVCDEGEGGVWHNDDLITESLFFGKFLGFHRLFY